MRALLLLLALGLASSASAQTPGAVDPPEQVRDEAQEVVSAAVLPGGIQRSALSLEGSPYPQKIFSADIGRTYAQITNETTNTEVLCVNAGFPADQVSIGKILYLQSIGWSGLAATFDVYCLSRSNTRLRLDELFPRIPNNPDAVDEVAANIVEPTPVPSSTTGSEFPGLAAPETYVPSPEFPNPSATPTPTPVLTIAGDSSYAVPTGSGTPTPTPTPVELEEN